MRKKLIEVALPLEAINVASAREKSIRHGHPSTLHLWWARRPLAACRAVLFGQLVDDPSSWPELFPTDEAQERERKRLFALIEQLVLWENSNNEKVINAARLEIARSIARGRRADGESDKRDAPVLAKSPTAATVNAYLAEVAPPVHDPFAGGGSIPLEAQRLGLRAIASDLNPVAVLINKALIEIPPKFAGMPPVNPESRRKEGLRTWKGAEGLAEDVRYYGHWLRDEAQKRIGHLYPDVRLPKNLGGGSATVIAWLWARTVASPNPACGGAHVPLVSSFWLSRKSGREAWVEPIVDGKEQQWCFEVRTGKPKDTKAVDLGTKVGRGDFRCLLSNDPIEAKYIRIEGREGRMGERLIAIVAEAPSGRQYVDATSAHESVAQIAIPEGAPDTDLPSQALGFRVQNYGMRKHRDLFTPRQFTALVTFSDLVDEAREKAKADALAAGWEHGDGLWEEGSGARAYSEAVAVCLAFGVSKASSRNCSLAIWEVGMGRLAGALGRQALSMVMDFAETNPFAGAGGDIEGTISSTCEVLDRLNGEAIATASIADAMTKKCGAREQGSVLSTDPPYYDNVPYADLSDFFYVWLRRSLGRVAPQHFTTVLVPKASELVAEPARHGGSDGAERFFLEGMNKALTNVTAMSSPEFPQAIFYAFKQAEVAETSVVSTGWETFLSSVIEVGLQVVGTWPARTEQASGLRDIGRNALASSIVLVCRKRPGNASAITRADFRRLLRQELPAALKTLQHGNIAPVDMAQASIGPGMGIFSRHSKVLEADGSVMSVRTALQLINQALDEYLAEQEGEFDTDTRFAVTWFETRGFEPGPFGEAETLAKARNVSVAGVEEAGVLVSKAGKVRLLKREELPGDWNPETDKRPTIWESTQHLIKRLEGKGSEQGAAELLVKLGARAAPARDLAYRLYTTCERKGWAEEARAYNGLVIAWPELEKLAAASAGHRAPVQEQLF